MKIKPVQYWRLIAAFSFILFLPYPLHAKPDLVRKMKGLHMPFIANMGQIDEEVAFYTRTFGGTVFVTRDGDIIYSLPKTDRKGKVVGGWVLKEEFEGSAIKHVTAEDKTPTAVSCFRGNDPSAWKSNVATYQLVNLGEVYKGIEVKLKAYGNNVEKLFYVKPGSRPDQIRVSVSGGKGIKINDAGALETETDLGSITFTTPFAYQEIKGKRVDVPVRYAILDADRKSARGGHVYGFSIGSYDKTETLVIDPLLQSTYIGGSNSDYGYSIAVDSSGNVYVTGESFSIDFPNANGYQSLHAGDGGKRDAFVTKLNSELTSIIQSTYLGGNGDDRAYAIAIDKNGNVYVAGQTSSTDFPGTAGGYGGNSDAFVAKLNSDLTTIQSMYLGGTGSDWANSIAVEAGGNIYVAGKTNSNIFPGTAGGAQALKGTGDDAFVTKLDSNLNTVNSTYLGGDGADEVYWIALYSGEGTTYVYAAGQTSSTNLPGASGGAQQSNGGAFDAFVTKLNSDLTLIVNSTYLGGSGYESAYSTVIDANGFVYVAGETSSTDFPGTSSGAQPSHGTDAGLSDAFVTKLNSELTSIVRSTYLGGDGDDYANAMAIDAIGNVCIAGQTISTNLAGTAIDSVQPHKGVSWDAFISRLNSDLTSIAKSTYLGGSGSESAYAIAIDSNDRIYVAGHTSSINFPGTAGGAQSAGKGGNEVFVSRFDSGLAGNTLAVSKTGNGTGSITDSLAGINCGSVCNMKYGIGTSIALTASPDTGCIFVGWSGGGCSGTGTCNLIMSNMDVTVTAMFSDITPPSNGLITINSGATITGSISVALSLSANDAGGVAEMKISNEDANWNTVTAVPYSPSIGWNLMPGDGIRTVYVMFKDAAGNWSSVYSASITLDQSPPIATISGTPAALNNARSASLTVGGTDVVAYKYKLDGGVYSVSEIPAGTPISLSSLSEGSHTVSVIGKDTAGNWQSEGSATTVTWTVDITPSMATISGMPASRTNATSASLTVGGTDVVAYRYKLDGGVYSVSEIPAGTLISLSSLSEGSHTVSVIGKDTAGNWQSEGSATTVTWTVDITPSTATISEMPASRTNSTSASLTVGGTDVVAYRYKLDGGVYSVSEIPAGTPISFSSLSEGSHTVSVIGKDTAGNWQSEGSATTAIWTVDITPSTATISGMPASRTNATSASLTVGGTDVVAYRYKLDGGVYSVSEIPAGTLISLSSLSEGSHTVSVIGKDTAGNWQSEGSATTAIWTVDITPSTATISGMPASLTNATSASLTVSGIDVVAYRYKLDGGVYSVSEIPAGTLISLSSLSEGSHTVSVIGKDTAGNWQSEGSATTAIWTVDFTPSTATISDMPAALTNTTSASLTIGGTDVVAYRYKLDGGVYSVSEIPAGTLISLSSLSEGSHTVSVIGKDTAGNWQSEGSATTAIWTVDITPSTATISEMPASRTNSTSASLTVGGTDVVAYRYKLDGGVYSVSEIPAGTPISFSSLSEGSHTVSVIGKDTAGNWQSEGSATTAIWTVDITPSTATISGMPASRTNATSASLTVGGTDVVAYRYKLDGGVYSVSEIPAGTPISLSSLSEGSHTVSVIGKDTAGNWQSEGSATTAIWTVDITPSTAMISGMPASLTNATSASLTVSGIDVVAYKYKLDGGVYSASEIPAGTLMSLSSLSEGSHTVSVIGKDTAGNWQSEGSATTAIWTVDFTPSTATISDMPAALTNTTSASLTIGGTDVVAYRYKLDGGVYSVSEIPAGTLISLSSLSEGSHTVSVIGKDTAGNWQSEGSATTAIWTVDITPSTATISDMPASRTNAMSASLTVSGIDVVAYRYKLDGGVYSVSEIPAGTPISLSSLSQGSHTVSVIAKDTAGNWQSEISATTIMWTVDITPSTATISDMPASRTNATSASLTVGGIDVVAYRYKLDGGVYSVSEIPAGTLISLSSLSEGSHTVYVIGKDSAGNWQSEGSATETKWTVDITPPITTISGMPASRTNATSASLTVGGTDVVAYRYKLDGGVYSVSEIPVGTPISLSSLSEGSHTVYVIGKDTAGNWQSEASATTVTWTVDITPSTATISGMPASRTNATSASLTVGGTDVVAYRYKLDGGVYSASEIPVGTPISLSSLSEASHTVSVISKDTAGNWQSEGSATTAIWTVDITPSTTTISGMPASLTNATSASLTVGGTDVVAYRYKLDGGVYSLSEIPAGTLISLSSLSEGSHTVYVIGKDSAGNWQSEGSATTIMWTVDITPSTATISGTPASLTNATSASLTVGGTDVVAYRYKLDGGVYSLSEIPVGTPISLSSLSEGSHTVYVIGKDTAGNWQSEGSATTVTWTVDTNPPTGTISINNGALGTRLTSVILNITATDTTSGVVKMSLSSDGVVYGEWEHFSPTRSWTLSLAPGEKSVYVKFKDAAGNESVPYSDKIMLDATEKGDIDGSGVVDLTDVILALQVMSRITPAVTIYKEADVNGDGRIGLPEVIYILQKVGEIR